MMRSKEGDKASSGGAIVLTSVAVSQLGTANHDVRAAAKGAVASLALGAASTYSEHNILVNCVAPPAGLIQCAVRYLTGLRRAQASAFVTHAGETKVRFCDMWRESQFLPATAPMLTSACLLHAVRHRRSTCQRELGAKNP